jgi:chaperone required for assembly of F1-ATPase
MVSPKGEIDQRPRRFYEKVTVVAFEGGWGIHLDGSALRTPQKKPLVAPTEKLARVIADEWAAQVERIDLQNMFNTRLINVVIDRTPAAREELANEVAKYAETDLVCHFAEHPGALIAKQDSGWTPLRVWAGEALGVALEPVEGILARRQPDASLDAARNHALQLDDYRLTGLIHGVGLLGSAVLGLAVERGRLTAAEAFELSRIDEAFQVAQWGEDAEAARRTERNRAEARALDLWFDALK